MIPSGRPTTGRWSRRRIDLGVAALLSVIVVGVASLIYLKSDARATTIETAPEESAPGVLTAPPVTLTQVWALTTSPRFAAVVLPSGAVVTADDHTVRAFDGATAAPRWSYSRSNVALCAVGSGDTADNTGTGVKGLVTAYSKSGDCSEITLLDPITGQRTKQRTGFTATDSTLVFGGPYGGLISRNLVELWRFDLVRTIEYGDQPEPTKPNTKRLGCDFTDIAVAATQFATIEHCAADGTSAQLVINYVDPGSTTDAKTKGWDALNFDPRATVTLASDHARLLSVTADEAAVLVADPAPAVVVYSFDGTEKSRTPVAVSADQIAAADSIGPVTPVTITKTARYAVVGNTLLAVSNDKLNTLWTVQGVLGRPAVVGDDLLVPVIDGIAVIPAATGAIAATIPVDRAGYIGRVDLDTVGQVVVESRGTAVVGLRDPAGAASETAASETAAPSTSARGRISIPGLEPAGTTAPGIPTASAPSSGG